MIVKTVKTPCIGICSTALGDDVCRGCKRYAHEVVDWNSYNHQQKAAIETRLVQLLTNVIQEKIQITDSKLLQWQIDQQPVMVPTHRNLYCQAHALLKAGASQIRDLSAFGLALTGAFQHVPLKTVCQQIDDEFYTLSVAHYQRYFQQFA